MNAPENKDPFAQHLARMAGDLTPAVDGQAMAGAAMQRERQRRVVLTVAACLGVLVAISGAMGAAGSVYADREAPMPASDTEQVDPSPSPSSSDGDGLRYVRTGDGELPVMPGVVHGVTGGQESILEGLWYEAPSGEWTAIGDVDVSGEVRWARPGAEYGWDDATGETHGGVADLELRKVVDAAGWTVPAKDSGAMTLEIEGADLVVIEPARLETEERDGKPVQIQAVTTRIRSGDEGWIIETRFTSDAAGDEMLRNFLGNLWLEKAGNPDWYEPMYAYPEIGSIDHAIPEGWTEGSVGGLSYAYPERWTAEAQGMATFGEQMEISSDEVVVVKPEYPDPEVRWYGYVESGDPGANFWPGMVPLDLEGTSEIEVPGADYGIVQVTEGPFYADAGVRSLSVDVYLHQEGNGDHSKLNLNFPSGDDGMELVRQFLGTLSYER